MVQTPSSTAAIVGRFAWILIGAIAGIGIQALLGRVFRPTITPDVELLPIFAKNVDTARLFMVSGKPLVGDLVENAVFYFVRLRYTGWRSEVECDLPQIYQKGKKQRLLPLGTTFWNGYPEARRTIQRSASRSEFCVCMLDQDQGVIRLWHSSRNRWIKSPEGEGTRAEIVIAPTSSGARVRSRLLELTSPQVGKATKLEVSSWAEVAGSWG